MLCHTVHQPSWYKNYADVLAGFMLIDGTKLFLSKIPYEKDTVHFCPLIKSS